MIDVMTARKLPAGALFLAAISASPSLAGSCGIYPPGPQRFACASANHPELIAKRERCKRQSADIGVHPGRGMSGFTYKEEIIACMHRR